VGVNWPAADPIYVYSVTGEAVLGAVREVIRAAAFHGRGGSPDTSLRLEIGLCAQQTELLFSIRDKGAGLDATAAALHSALLAMVGDF
jgi:anti-sigma regulatory factor (Ser/Thr protein kinase)